MSVSLNIKSRGSPNMFANVQVFHADGKSSASKFKMNENFEGDPDITKELVVNHIDEANSRVVIVVDVETAK